MKKDWSQTRWIALLPLVAVIFLYLTEGSTRNFFFTCGPTAGTGCRSIPDSIWDVFRVDQSGKGTVVFSSTASPKDQLSPDLYQRKVIGLRYSGRIAWFSLVELYLMVCLAVYAVSIVYLVQRFRRNRWQWALGVLLASGVIGLLLFKNPLSHMAVFKTLLETAIIIDLHGIVDITNFLNSFGNAATFALLLTICAQLLPTSLEPYPSGMKQLSNTMKVLRNLLYAGTLLLVVTMLLKNAIWQWALAYTTQDSDSLAIAKSFITSFMSLDGTFYTLLLAAGYVPAWLVILRRARLVQGLPAEESEVEKKLQEYGLTFSFVKSIPRIIAIIAPFLAGPVGDLLKSILS